MEATQQQNPGSYGPPLGNIGNVPAALLSIVFSGAMTAFGARIHSGPSAQTVNETWLKDAWRRSAADALAIYNELQQQAQAQGFVGFPGNLGHRTGQIGATGG